MGFLRRPKNLKKYLSYFWQEHRVLCAQQHTCQKVDKDFSKQRWSSCIIQTLHSKDSSEYNGHWIKLGFSMLSSVQWHAGLYLSEASIKAFHWIIVSVNLACLGWQKRPEKWLHSSVIPATLFFRAQVEDATDNSCANSRTYKKNDCWFF